MTQLIMGNIFAFLASLCMVYSGIIKEKKKILIVQAIQIGMFIISNLIFGGIVGAIVNFISLFRNIICYKDKLGIKEIVILTILSVGLSLCFNNLGFIGLLPLIASTLYLWFMNVKDIKYFKILMILTTVLWLIYDICIKSYSSAVFELMTIITNFISLLSLSKIVSKK